MVATNQIAVREDGIKAMELAPLNPHTTSKQARECVDCHGNKKAVGFGSDGGIYDNNQAQAKYADAKNINGEPLSRHATPQIPAIPEMTGNFEPCLMLTVTSL